MMYEVVCGICQQAYMTNGANGTCPSCWNRDYIAEGRVSDTKPTNPKDAVATNRLDLSLFPSTAVAYGALALTEGHLKYGSYNWRKAGVLASIYYAAANRHLDKWFNGEWADAKTHVPHLASALASIAILIDAIEVGKFNDDRPPIAPVADLLAKAEPAVEHLRRLFGDGPGRVTAALQQESEKIP